MPQTKKSKKANKPKGAAPAERLAAGLFDALKAVDAAPPPGARDLPVIEGITPGGLFGLPQETLVHRFAGVLADSKRVYSYGNSIVLSSSTAGEDDGIVAVRTGTQVEPCAPGLLANILVCRQTVKDQPVEFPVPPRALGVLLAAEPLLAALPRVKLYAHRPLFDADFRLLGPGYHLGPGYLIHGPTVEPHLDPLPAADHPLDRLPPRLNALLRGFCFREPTDLVNTLGLFLTGVLINHFVTVLKAVALVDANQPGLGKMLLVRVLGQLLDVVDPHLVHYTPDDEELQKRIFATLRPGVQSVLVVDNAKQPSGSPIGSPALESNSVAPEISLRILRTSSNFVRPNDVLWALTMNQTRVSPDLVSRGLPIRLSYSGPPEARRFAGPDPIEYAREHRVELLGELAGMVLRWTRAGRPTGERSHRLHRWAGVIGGILAANGFAGFLDNYEEAAHSFDAELEELTALDEAALTTPNGPFVITTEEDLDE